MMEKYINDPVAYAAEVVAKDPMAQFLGITADEVKQGYARCSVTIKPDYLNALEKAHGAIVYALMDQALAVASNSTGHVAVSLNVSITYTASAIDGEKIFAEAVPIRIGNKVSVWKINVTGSDDKIIASGEGLAYHR
jgi:acyl-CoA thioesterase